MKNKHLIAIILLGFSIFGCGVPKEEHEKLKTEHENLKREYEQMQSQTQSLFESPRIGNIILEDGLISTGFSIIEGKATFSLFKQVLFSQKVAAVDVNFIDAEAQEVLTSKRFLTTENENGVSIAEISLPEGIKPKTIVTLHVKMANI